MMFERVLETARAGFVRPLTRVLPSWMTPNVLSWSRLFLAVALAVFLWRGLLWSAALVYVFALLTDAFDGEVARTRSQKTTLGARLDPSVDKVLHGVLFLYFWPVAPWLLGTLLGLDIGLFFFGLLIVARARKAPQDVSASVFGRWKMILQALGCATLFWNALLPMLPVPFAVVMALFGLAVLFAVLSLLGYLPRLRAAWSPTGKPMAPK